MSRFHGHEMRERARSSGSFRLVSASFSLVLTVLGVLGCGRAELMAPSYRGYTPPYTRGTVGTRQAQGTPSTAQQFTEALHLEGTIGPGALWSIDRPADWNGDLVVYLHGYTNPALPVARPDFGSIRDALLSRGFAVVASSYSENGYAVKEGLEQSHQLRGIFASRVATPGRTFVFGQSLGGLIGMLMTQKYPGQYDGTLLVCGVVGGSDDEIQYLGDIRVLFDAVYPGVLSGDLEHSPLITDVNAQVIGPVLQAVGSNPQGLGIIQRLARHPLAGANNQEIVTSLLNALIFGLQGGSDLFDRTHGHTFFDNAGWRYSSPALPPALVDDINARVARYAAEPAAEAFLQHYGEPAGPFRVPLIAMHTTRDPVVPIFHEDLLGAVSAGPDLLQRRTDRYGHCNFSVAELMASFDDLVAWVATGQRPPV